VNAFMGIWGLAPKKNYSMGMDTSQASMILPRVYNISKVFLLLLWTLTEAATYSFKATVVLEWLTVLSEWLTALLIFSCKYVQ